MSSNALQMAINQIGSMSSLAAALGVTKGAVGQWKLPGRNIPAEHCPVIERLTGGKVRCEDLNPEIDWAFLRTTCKPELTPVETT